MNFRKHYNLEGKHAFLSASKSSWLNYDDDKLDATYRTALAAKRGTDLHDLAYRLIKLGVNLERNTQTLNQYVNDAIGFRMDPEVVLFYSDNVFGTADTISYRRNPKTGLNILRIHDLKTGINAAKFDQLEIYVAMFCLEYNVNPKDIEIELRIYQNDSVEIHIPELHSIVYIMDKIKNFDMRIDLLKHEVES